MLLSDIDILSAMAEGEISVSPFDRERLQPASLDVCLDSYYRVPRGDVGCLDVADLVPHTDLVDDDFLIPLEPGDFILATTRERVTLGNQIAARVEGKSSIGRLGVLVHSTAGFIDPGFTGQVTLEISNIAPWEVQLRPGMRIAQLAFQRLSSPVARPYQGNYQNQVGPQESRFRLS
jgi:dCTP deaminase